MGLSKTGALAVLLFTLAMAGCAGAYTLTINNGDTMTNNPVVNLTWSAPGSYWTSFSCDGTNWTSWEVFPSGTRTFNLDSEAGAGCPSAGGTKTVYFRAREFDNTPLLQVIDNTDAGFYTYGAGGGFTASSLGSGYYGANYTYSAPDSGNRARWRFTPPVTGDYEVFGWWPARSTNATNSRFSLTHDDGGGATITTNVTRDQQAEGNEWVSLGTYHYLAQQYQALMRDEGRNGIVAADALGVDMPAADTIVLDAGEPDSTITNPTNLQVIYDTDFPYTVEGTSSNGVAGITLVQFRATKQGDTPGSWSDAAGAPNWSYSWGYPAGGDGTYTLESRAQDGAGNWETAIENVTVLVDSGAPTGNSIIINAGEMATNDPDVTLALTAVDAATMQFSCDNSNWTAWEPYAATKAFNLESQAGAGCVAGDGIKEVYVRARDILLNVSTEVSDDIILDRVFPSVSIDDPSVGTPIPSIGFFRFRQSDFPVTLTGTSQDDSSGVANIELDFYKEYDNTPYFTVTATGTTNWSYGWAFPGDGIYEVTIKPTDNAGNVPLAIQIVGFAVGDIPEVTINGGADYANNPVVTLDIAANGPADDMSFSCTGNPADWTTWEPFSASRFFNLETEPGAGCGAGDDFKRVWIIVRDSGDIRYGLFDEITLDRVNPACVITYPAAGGTIYEIDFPYDIIGNASDNQAVSGVYVRFDGGAWQLANNTITWDYSWVNPGVDEDFDIECRAIDGAGNESAYDLVTVTVETMPPTGLGIVINSGDLLTTNSLVTLALNADDATEMSFSCDNSNWTAWEAYNPVRVFNFGAEPLGGCDAGDGVKGIYFRARDLEGKVSYAPVIVDNSDSGFLTNGFTNSRRFLGFFGTNYAQSPAEAGAEWARWNFDVPMAMNYDVYARWSSAANRPADAPFIITHRDGTDTVTVNQEINGGAWTLLGNYPFNAAAYNIETRNTVAGRVIADAVLIGDPAQDDIVLDTTAPNPVSILINNGDLYTTNPELLLTLGAVDNFGAREMRFSCDNASWTVWENYAASRNFNLADYAAVGCTTTDGAKTVYFMARDEALNLSAVAQDDIILDNSEPDSLIVLPPDGNYFNAGMFPVAVSGTASNGPSGVALVQARVNGGIWEDAVGTTNWSYDWAFPGAQGTYLIESRATDNAGNVETSYSGISVTVDTEAPTNPTIEINGGDNATGNPDVTLTVSANDNYPPLGYMQFSCDGSTWGAPVPYATAFTPFNLETGPGCSVGDGTKSVYFRAYDQAWNESATVSDIIFLDTTGPDNLTIEINGGDTYTRDPAVTLTLYAEDNDGFGNMEFSCNGANWTSGELYQTSANFSLINEPGAGCVDVDGLITVYFRVYDAAGNINQGGPATDTIILDRVTPVINAFTINNYDAYANSAASTLTINATDNEAIDRMRFSCTGLAGEWTAWEPYNTAKSFDLAGEAGAFCTDTDGTKTVYLRVRDEAGNRANTTDTIVLDREAPINQSIVIEGGAVYTNTAVVGLTLFADDVTTDANTMEFSCDGSNWTVPVPYATAFPGFNLVSQPGAGCVAGDGVKEVYFRATDSAGNTATAVSDDIILDTQGPTNLTIMINGGAAYTNNGIAGLALGATDNYEMGEMRFSCNGADWTALEPYSAFRGNYDLTAELGAGCTLGDGTKTVFFSATDAAGNSYAGPPVFDTIILDRAPPTSYIYDPFNEQVLTIYNFPYLVHGIADDNASGIAAVEFRQNGGLWQSAGGTTNWTFSWAQQPEGIYVLDSRATDNAGNVQTDFNAITVYVGISPPTDMNIVINGGAEYTTIADVMLTLQAMNAKEMRFSCVADPSNPEDPAVPWTNWMPFNSPQRFDLEYGLNGYLAGCVAGMNPVPKIVYFQARTNMLVKSAIISDTIILDRIAPNDLNIFINGNAVDTNEAAVGVAVDANGVGEFALGCTSAGPWTPWYAFTSHPVTREFNLTNTTYGCTTGDGLKQVWMRARDFAQGNIASPVFDTINLDRAEPDSGITNLVDGNFLNEDDFPIIDPNFVIEGDSRDNTGGSGIARVDIRFIHDGNAGPWYPIIPLGDGTWTYTWGYPGEGVWTIETMARDNAGNFEKSIEDVTVTLDTTEPVGPSIVIDNNVFATNDSNVMLALFAADAVEMSFSCDSFTWTTPEPYAISKAFSIEYGDIADGETAGCNFGDGIKTVFFMVWDSAGNDTDSPFPQDLIILDTVKPFSTITQPLNGDVIGPAAMPYGITGTSTDLGGSGVERVEVRINGGTWTTAANLNPWTYPWGPVPDGNYIIESRAVDRAGNYELAVQDVNVRVGVVPLAPSVVIDDHNAFTNDVIVQLDLNVIGPTPAENMRFSCDNANWTAWETFALTRDFNIVAEPLAGCTDVDGTKAVYFQAHNFIGNSVVASDDIVLDRIPPTGLTLVINDGNAFANTGSATLAVAGVDVNKMSFSCDNASWTAWEPYTATRAFDLEAEPLAGCTAGDGNKAVFFRALDRANNLSGVIMDDIELDMGEPDSTITDPVDGNYLTALPFIVRGDASNGASGIALVQARFNGGTWIDAIGTTNWSYNWVAGADGNYYIESRAFDGAGNWETTIEGVNVVLDTIPPQNPGIVIDGNAPFTAGRDVVLTLYAEDASHMQFSCDNANWTTKEPYATSRAFNLEVEAGANCTTGDGVKRVYFRAVDLANRASIVVWDDITLDRGEPDSDITAPFNGADLNAMAFPYTIAGIAADAWSGIGLVQVRFNGGAWADATGTIAWTYNWAYPGTDGSYLIESRAQDGAGNWETSIENITVNVDTLPPQGMSIMINDNNDYANSADTVLTLGAVGAAQMEFSCNNTAWSAPVPYGTSAPFNVNTGSGCGVGDGPKTVFFRATDAAGNSDVVSDGIYLDTQAPTGLSVTINSGDVFTNDPDASLALVVTGASHMQFSCDNSTWTGWEAVAASRNFDLVAEAGAGCTGIDGNKPVYFMARDLAWNVAGPVTDDIELDRGEPDSDIANLVDGNSLSAGDFPYLITGTAVNGASGITLVQVRFNGGAWIAATGTTNWTYSWAAPADGNYLIESRAQDGAGNWETTIEGVTVTVDNTPPTGLGVLINSGDAWTNDAGTILTVGATGADEMQFSCTGNAGGWTAWEAYNTARAFNVESEAGANCTAGDGVKTVYFQARDNAGNLSLATVNDTIGLDTVNPVAGAVSPLDASATQDRRPPIMINFNDVDSGTDTAASTLYIDGVAVSADVNSLGASYTPTSDLSVGQHDVNMHIYDNAGNLLNEHWAFTVSLTTHNLSVQGITAPASEAYGNAVNVTVDVENEGLVTETGVLVRLYADGVQVDNATIPNINAGQVIPVGLAWASADTEGTVELKVAVEPVTGEIVKSDNNAIRYIDILAGHDILVNNAVWGTGNTIFLYDAVNVSADLTNNGDLNENVTVQLLAYHMSTGWVVADTATVAVADGTTENVSFSWDAGRKNYNTLIIRALPVGGEANTADNEAQSTLRIWSIADYIELEWFSGTGHPPANTTAGTNVYSMFWVKNFMQNVEDFDAIPITISVDGAFTVANSMACGAAPGCTIDVAFMDDEYYWWLFGIDNPGNYTVTITAGSDPADQATITRGVNVA